MRMNLRNRILVNFVLVIVAFAIISAFLGTFFINRTTIKEEQTRVGADLRSAWGVFQAKFNELSILVSVLGSGKRVAGAYVDEEIDSSRIALEAVRRQLGLDFLGLTDDTGRVILRTAEPYHIGDDLSNDPFVSSALKKNGLSGFYLFSPGRLALEGGEIRERAYMVFKPTPKAKPRAKSSEEAGLVMVAAAPIQDRKGRVFGAIYAGLLLNRNHALVDQIRSLVFEDQLLRGRPIGTVTVFQWDVRVATNVILPNGNRALGTRVSAEVYDKVLENGGNWYDRAFVVNDWYISAYDPILDVTGKVIGILYVGVLAEKYDQIRRSLWKIYGTVSGIGALLIIIMGLIFARRLTRSVGRLAEAATKISGGKLDLRVPEPKADDELRDLTKAFNAMSASLLDRDQRLEAARTDLEKTNTTLQRVNQNYLDMLSFVSHELKNSLGVIYTSARTLDAGLAGPLNRNQTDLVGSIARNINQTVAMTKKYLDLTRIEKGELDVQWQDMDLVADVVGPVLEEINEVARQKRIEIYNYLPHQLPLAGDPTLLRVVYRNLLDNALKYGLEGGQIRLGFKHDADEYRFEVWNDGGGLSPDQINKLFGKFIRLVSENQSERVGTGLGLFITREIITKHGGRIWAESEAGHWINFIFTLPVKLSVSSPVTTPSSPDQAL